MVRDPSRNDTTTDRAPTPFTETRPATVPSGGGVAHVKTTSVPSPATTVAVRTFTQRMPTKSEIRTVYVPGARSGNLYSPFPSVTLVATPGPSRVASRTVTPERGAPSPVTIGQRVFKRDAEQ